MEELDGSSFKVKPTQPPPHIFPLSAFSKKITAINLQEVPF